MREWEKTHNVFISHSNQSLYICQFTKMKKEIFNFKNENLKVLSL